VNRRKTARGKGQGPTKFNYKLLRKGRKGGGRDGEKRGTELPPLKDKESEGGGVKKLAGGEKWRKKRLNTQNNTGGTSAGGMVLNSQRPYVFRSVGKGWDPPTPGGKTVWGVKHFS